MTQSCTVLSVEHHFVVAQLQKSHSRSYLTRTQSWISGSAASSLTLREITAKS